MALNNEITKVGVSLGSTLDGSNWCMKALNPASPVSVSGIPDSSTTARVVKHFERTFTFSFPTASANWSLDVVLHPNPAIIACGMVTDGVNTSFSSITNNQLGSNPTNIYNFIYRDIEGYRLCYGSMTAILDATSVTNSGLVAASQYPLMPMHVDFVDSSSKAIFRRYDAWPDYPRNYDTLVQMPGTYVGSAKEGCYLLLRVEPSSKWTRVNDVSLHINTDEALVMGLDDVTHVANALPSAGAGFPASWPFGIIGTSVEQNSLAFLNCQDNIGHFAMRNLHKDATVRVTYRMGFEFAVVPGTTYSPDLRLPPLYDPMSMEAYKIVSGKLALAYPASFNDWQKIVKLIYDAAKEVAPILFGPLGSVVPAIGEKVFSVGKGLVKAAVARRAQRKKANNLARKQVVVATPTKKNPQAKLIIQRNLPKKK